MTFLSCTRVRGRRTLRIWHGMVLAWGVKPGIPATRQSFFSLGQANNGCLVVHSWLRAATNICFRAHGRSK